MQDKQDVHEALWQLQMEMNAAACNGNLEVVEALGESVPSLTCSGHLMEELIQKGHRPVADYLVANNKVWGSALNQYSAWISDFDGRA